MGLSLRVEEARGARFGTSTAWGPALPALAGIGCVLLGALYPVSASLLGPRTLPVAIVGLLLLWLSLKRPATGVAVAMLLTSVSPGLAYALRLNADPFDPYSSGGLPWWVFSTAWTALLFLLLVLRPSVPGVVPEKRLPPLGLPVLVFGAVVLAGYATSPAQDLGLPVLRSTLTGILLFFVAASSLRSWADIATVLRGTSGAALVAGGLACLQHIGGASTGIGFITSSGVLVDRVTGGFAHPNQLAGFLVALVPLASAAAVVDRRWRLLHLAGLALALGGIYASFSRGALVAVVVMPLLLVRGRWLLLLTPVAVLTFGVAIPSVLAERFALGNEDGAEVAGRRDIWSTAYAIWLERPLLGAGLGSFPGSYATVRVSGKQFLEDTRFEPPPHAHNLELQLLAEQGLVGLTAFGAAIAAAGRRAWQLRRSRQRGLAMLGAAMLTSIVGMLVHNQFDVTLLESSGVQFWAVLGILGAVIALDLPEGGADGR